MARPRVRIQEESIPSAISAVATGRLAYVVVAEQGAVGRFLYIEDEDDLNQTLGDPTSATTDDYHICKDFLTYGNDLVLVRAVDEDTAKLGRVGIIGSSLGQTGYDGEDISETGDDVYFTDYQSHTIKAANDLEFYSKEPFDNASLISVAVSKYTGSDWASNTDTINGTTLFSDEFEFGPDSSNGEIALVVLYNGTIVERWIVSLTSGAKNVQNENIYISDFLEANSDYIWGYAKSTSYASISSFTALALKDGSKGSTPSQGDIEDAYAKFLNKNDIEFDYILDGTHYLNRSYIIDTIAEGRKDCVAYVGPPKSDLIASNVPLTNTDTIVSNIVTDRQTLTNSSWASYSGNWKSVYDKFQDKQIWIPCTSSVVGAKVRTNSEAELWQPAAGTTYGVLLNVDKLAFNPTEGQQNTLYKNGINHIINRPGKGTYVDGQKTMYNQNVGVSRVNIRDLFRFVEKFTAEAAVDFLHQYNDAITRARFVSILNPFLEDIQNRRGIVDFEVRCDESNNPASITDNYGFRADVLIKGNRAIEDILIKFYDVPTGVAFDELT